MLWIGFQLNQQGELFEPETGTVHFGYAFLIFALWFLATFVVLAASASSSLELVVLPSGFGPIPRSDAVARTAHSVRPPASTRETNPRCAGRAPAEVLLIARNEGAVM